MLVAVIYLRRRRRRQRSLDKGKGGVAEPSEENQPYLQQKAELEAAQKRQLELDGREVRYEMDGAQTRHEVEGAESANEMSERPWLQGSLLLTHELRGEEHSKELEGIETR